MYVRQHVTTILVFASMQILTSQVLIFAEDEGGQQEPDHDEARLGNDTF